MNGGANDNPGTPDHGANEPEPGSGEGADTALQALIRKRKLRAEDESPSASADLPDTAQPPAP